MGPKELFKSTVKQAGPCIMHIRPEHLANSTPCSDWNLRALLNHLIYELLWVPELLKGKTVEEVGSRFDGDVLDDEPVGAWKTASGNALAAVESADPDMNVHLSRGDVPLSQYLHEISNDVLIHGWDIGQSINCSLIFEPDTAQALYDFMSHEIAAYRESGAIGEEVSVPADAPLQTKLLALEGRRDRP